MISNSVTKVNGTGKVPILITNNTGREFKLRKGNVVARIEKTSGTIDVLYSKPTNKNGAVQVSQTKRCIELQT